MTERSLILFPHSFITVEKLKKIDTLSSRLTICHPWFMDTPIPFRDENDFPNVNILRPSINLKPENNFRKLFTHYQTWAMQNREKDYSGFLIAFREMATEDKAWDIREMLRKPGATAKADPKEQALKWHLMLHLAREIEENLQEVEGMFYLLKQEGSPLRDALEDKSASKGLFDGMPKSDTNSLVGEHHLSQVIEAWLGLFGEYISDEKLLITLDQKVLDYVTGIFDDIIYQEESQNPVPDETSFGPVNAVIKKLPLLADDGEVRKDPLLKGLSGKTIIMLED
ncbi:MAG: hypothetical protein J7L16_09915 [Deltaproteobacteria bacterium]|nr:hypothetical protein [Deltaproteobacteria bacterium]